MRWEQLIGNGAKKSFQDLNPLFAGCETCAPGHSFGPHIREYYLLHYCRAGRGTFSAERGTYTVEPGQVFAIRPGEVTRYEADRMNPWEYVWIAFSGRYAEKLDTLPDVFSCSDATFEKILDLIQEGESAPEPYVSLLYDFFYHLDDEKQRHVDVSKQIKNYIDFHYMEALTVEEIAARFGFDRRYLSRIFARKYGLPIKEYMVTLRMEKARRFLQDGHSVSDTAFFVGYRDPLNFSRMFKKALGQSPTFYRKNTGQINDTPNEKH